MPGPMDEIVVEGAQLRCTMGLAPTVLKVTNAPIPPPPPGPQPPLPPGARRLKKKRRQRTQPGGAAGPGQITCDGKRIATIYDFMPQANIGPFGMCRSMANPQVASATTAAQGVLTPQPCVPMINWGWNPQSPDVKVGTVPAFGKKATCLCQWAGVISIVHSGQGSTKDSLAPALPAAPADDWKSWFRPDLNPKMKKSYWDKLKRQKRKGRG